MSNVNGKYLMIIVRNHLKSTKYINRHYSSSQIVKSGVWPTNSLRSSSLVSTETVKSESNKSCSYYTLSSPNSSVSIAPAYKYLGQKRHSLQQSIRKKAPICIPQENYFKSFSTNDFLEEISTSTTSSSSSSSSSSSQNEPQRRIQFPPQATLFDKVQIIQSMPLGTIHPLDISFQCAKLIQDCCKLQSLPGMNRAMDLLSRLLEEKRYKNDIWLRQQKQPKPAYQQSNDSYEDEEEFWKRQQIIVKDYIFHIVMYGWANLKPVARPDETQRILEWMEKENAYDERIMLKNTNGNTHSNGDMMVVVDGHEIDLEGILEEDEDYRSSTNYDNYLNPSKRKILSCQPTTISYNTHLTALANAAASSSGNKPNAAQRAESLLKTMYELHTQKSWHTKPNTRSYGLVIKAYANSKSYTAGENAERVFRTLMKVHEKELEQYKVDSGGVPYNLKDESQNVRKIVTPDTMAYSGVIHAYANSNARGSAERAEQLLLEMMQRDVVDDDNDEMDGSEDKRVDSIIIRPDAMVFTSTIRAWAVAASKMGNPKARYEAAEHAEGILNIMLSLADEWDSDHSRHGNAYDEPESYPIDDSDTEINYKGAGDEEQHWNENRSSKDASVRLKNPFRPTLMTYNIVLDAWAKSDIRESAPRAEKLLHQMIDTAMENVITNDNDTITNGRTQGSNPSIIPDTSSFHSTMNAWARYGKYDTESAHKVEALIAVMYDMYHSGRFDENIKPTAWTYSIAINAWARSEVGTVGSTDESDSVSVTEKDELVNEDFNKSNKVENARRLLDTMLYKYEAGEQDMKPNSFAYTSVINSAAHYPSNANPLSSTSTGEDGRDNVPLNIALRTYNEICDDVHDLNLSPDHFVYATMLKVVASHSIDPRGTSKDNSRRRELIERIFSDACKAGHVSSLVLSELKDACATDNEDLFQNLLECGDGEKKKSKSGKSSINQLPGEWTRNVRYDGRMRKANFQGNKGNKYKKKR